MPTSFLNKKICVGNNRPILVVKNRGLLDFESSISIAKVPLFQQAHLWFLKTISKP